MDINKIAHLSSSQNSTGINAEFRSIFFVSVITICLWAKKRNKNSTIFFLFLTNLASTVCGELE